MCETDFSGYPDCRDDTIKALQVALGSGMDHRFTLETPLMWIDKSQTWALAKALGGEALVGLITRTPIPATWENAGAPRVGLRLRHLPGVRTERKTGFESYVCAGETFTSRC